MSVYFARVADYIKVGYSRNPIHRAESVTRLGERPDDVPFGSPVDLVGWVPGDRKREAAFHRQYAGSWVAGEWFRIDRAEVAELIWRDPFGVDIGRMSMMAVLACLKHPGMTRDEIEAAGVPVLGHPLDTALVFGGECA